jgi:hypothetical protein
VPSVPPTARELDAYRERGDRFVAALDEELYLHYAGHKPEFELQGLYEEYGDLFSQHWASALGAAEDGSFRSRQLWRFACEGYLGQLTKELEEKAAHAEATLTTRVDGRDLPYRMIRPTMMNEPDREKRERLEQARNELVAEHLNPLHREGEELVWDALPALGADTYRGLYERFGMDLEDLGAQCRAVIDDTEALYVKHMDRLFRARLGLRLDQAKRWDVVRLFRAPEWDEHFRGDQMVPALEATLADLGIDLKRQANVHLDIEQRPNKSPRAFCAPIEVPGRVMLVIQPAGGADDWSALFHEAGHTEHFAHTSASLPFEDRRLGDNAVTEGWAMLMQHLVDDPAWLTRRLDFPRPEDWAVEGATSLLYFVRRYSAKILYELEFHARRDKTGMDALYVELLTDALKIEPSRTDCLGDIDGGYYVSSYLRSWAFEAQLRTHLREQFGERWFASRDAGMLLRELWETGQSLPAEAMLKDVTGQTLVMSSVADRIRETLGD